MRLAVLRRDKLMKLHPIKVISLFLCLSLTSVYAANSDYWTEFERENRKTGLSLINHIQNLVLLLLLLQQLSDGLFLN